MTYPQPSSQSSIIDTGFGFPEEMTRISKKIGSGFTFS